MTGKVRVLAAMGAAVTIVDRDAVVFIDYFKPGKLNELSHNHQVCSDSPRYAVDLLHPRALERLLQVEPFRWRIDGSDVLTWSADLDPETLLQRLRVLIGIVRQVPRHVIADRARSR